MNASKGVLFVAVALALAMSTPASAILFHGATIAKNTESPKAPLEYLEVSIEVGYNDDYGDTIQINECWDVVDIGGDNVRVPAVGSLEIIAVSGNTTATVGGSLPVKIGPSGSTLSGLPGNVGDGAVVFGHSASYEIQLDDPNPLPDQANAYVQDLCDAPGTSGCSSIVNLLQFVASTTIECPEPCVEITKALVPDSPTFSKVGDTVTYRICIENCGEFFDLINVVVTDPLLGGVLAGFPSTLTPGQQACVDFPYVVKEGDPDPLTNTATVTGTDACDEVTEATDEASSEVDLVQPAIEIVKECDPPTASVGDLITYTITITNTGNVDLENVTVSDSLLGDLSASFVDTLAPLASDTQVFNRTLLDTDPNPLVNTATVNATVVALGNALSDEDSCEVTQQGNTFCSFTL